MKQVSILFAHVITETCQELRSFCPWIMNPPLLLIDRGTNKPEIIIVAHVCKRAAGVKVEIKEDQNRTVG